MNTVRPVGASQLPHLRLTVAIPTYQRPRQLAAGLPGVLAQVRAVTAAADLAVSADVLVVDNDAAASAATVVHDLAADDLRYVVEPVPGIVAARNRALDEGARYDLLVFIDDDETPRASWLAELVRTYLATRPAAVVGRVVSQYDRNQVDPWVAAGNLFERPSWPTGTELTIAQSGNLLLDIAQLREKGVRFDERLGMSGGEDSLLSRVLADRGGRIVFCAESVADDHVVAERLSRRWLLDRAVSQGSVQVLVDLLLADSAAQRRRVRASGLLRGLARMAGGSVRIAVGLTTRSLPRRVIGSRTLWRGVGMVRAAAGQHVEEYKRD